MSLISIGQHAKVKAATRLFQRIVRVAWW